MLIAYFKPCENQTRLPLLSVSQLLLHALVRTGEQRVYRLVAGAYALGTDCRCPDETRFTYRGKTRSHSEVNFVLLIEASIEEKTMRWLWGERCCTVPGTWGKKQQPHQQQAAPHQLRIAFSVWTAGVVCYGLTTSSSGFLMYVNQISQLPVC